MDLIAAAMAVRTRWEATAAAAPRASPNTPSGCSVWTRMSVLCHPRPAAVPPATTPSVASAASAPLALTLTRSSGAARTSMSALGRAAPAATAAPTPRAAFCVAAPKATSGPGKGTVSLPWPSALDPRRPQVRRRRSRFLRKPAINARSMASLLRTGPGAAPREATR